MAITRSNAVDAEAEPGPSRNKGRKTTHKKSNLAQAAREAVLEQPSTSGINVEKPPTANKITQQQPAAKKSTTRKVVQCAPENFPEDAEWEIQQFGGLYLLWGKKKVRQPDGSIKIQPYLKDRSEHRIWIKWTVAFSDGIRWSAEKQDKLVGVSKETISKIINDGKAWPLPSRKEGDRSLWRERRSICQLNGIRQWRPTPRNKPGQRWQLIDPELPSTTSEVDSTDDDSDEDEA